MIKFGVISSEVIKLRTGRFINSDFKNFGMVRERIIKKVNPSRNLLKLSDNTSEESVYPMVDEFALLPFDQFIFKSNWDDFHVIYEIDNISSFNKFPIEYN